MNQATEVVVYEPNEATLVETVAKVRGLKIAGVDDKKGYGLVHEARMELKGFRVKIEKDRKQLTADAVEWQRKVNAEAKRLTALIEPTERELEAEEDRIDAEKARIAAEEEAARRKVLDDRMAALAAVGCQAVPSEIEDMGEHEFADVLKVATEAHQEKLEAERVAAAERGRVAAEEEAARKAEQERQAAERAETERAQKAERERLAVERAELERQQAAQRAESEKLAKEREAFEAERLRIRIQQEEETARKEAAEREAAAKVERDRAAAEEAARLEKLKPEIEKVRAFAESLDGLEAPAVWCASSIRDVLDNARDQIFALAEAQS